MWREPSSLQCSAPNAAVPQPWPLPRDGAQHLLWKPGVGSEVSEPQSPCLYNGNACGVQVRTQKVAQDWPRLGGRSAGERDPGR